jgi:polysaccharide export outer membrane protein
VVSARSRLARCLPLAVLVLAGCATAGAPRPADGVGLVATPPPAAAEPMRLPPAVQENATFVMVDGRASYKIGPGDVLEVLLSKELAQERLTADVKPNGGMTVGFAEVRVVGLTAEQAATEIQRALAPTHRALAVAVTVKEFRSKTVSVLGEVQNNAQLSLKGRTTLVDILVTAGGPRAQADLREVRLLRRDGQTFTVDLLRLVSEGGQVGDLVLDAGDVVFVPGKRTEEHKVFLLGEVNAPGAYPIVPNMRLSQALALAGGPKDTALLDSARVIRGDLRNPQVVQVDFERALTGEDRAQDLVLERNDLIVIPRSAIANWNAFLAKLKPTLEFLSLPLAPFSQYLLIRELLRD